MNLTYESGVVMSNNPSVLLSAFADEAANHKTVLEQFSALAAIGLRYYSPRFMDVDGSGTVKHVVDLNKKELKKLGKLHAEFGMSVTSIGARIGKVKLLDIDDGSHNAFIPFQKYLDTEVKKTISVGVALGTKLIRGFSFYHPRGTSPADHIPQAVEQIGKIADACQAAGLIFGLEIEPNLIGETGPLLAQIAKKLKHPNMLLIYDGGNIAAQNKDRLQCLSEFHDMLPYLGWMHIKDYAIDRSMNWTGAVDEDRLKNFVPADRGDAGHELLLRELREQLPKLTRKLSKLGVPGFFLEVEPHLKGGGQFGGFSGPDGVGVAVRALCSVLDYCDVDYDIRNFEDIRTIRGF
jgi:L-ribulose-5-phosphate 3-epimerase UlaE